MDLVVARATETHAEEIAAIRTAAARDLTSRFGTGHWSQESTPRGVLSQIRTGHVLIGRLEGQVAGALVLQTKKPWAIDRSYFTPVARALYLVDMAVLPALRRRGIGSRLLDAAVSVAQEWPAEAIRLDAYDHAAGAGPFYANHGFSKVGRVVYKGDPLVYYESVLGSGSDKG